MGLSLFEKCEVVCVCAYVGSGGKEGGAVGQGECEVGRRGSGRQASPDRNHVWKVKSGEWTGLERVQRCVCDVRTYQYVHTCEDGAGGTVGDGRIEGTNATMPRS